MEFYLEVDDIEKVWSGMKDKPGDISVKEPFDKSYGMREIHIVVPETNTLLFILLDNKYISDALPGQCT